MPAAAPRVRRAVRAAGDRLPTVASMRAVPALQPGRSSGRRVLALGLAGTLTLAGIDLGLAGRLTMFFDLGFVTLCLGLGRLPSRRASYAVAFAPPALLVMVFGLLAVIDPGLLGHRGDDLLQAVIAGLTGHAAALAAGYALCLAALAARLPRERELRPRTG